MFLYWHRTSWLDVRSNLGCLPPSSFSSAAPQPPLPCLAFASLATLSFTSLCNLSTFSLSLRISSCSFLSSASLSKPMSFPKSRSWKQQKLWSRWMWESFKYTQLDPRVPLSLLLKLLKLGKSLCWNYPCPVEAAPMWSVGEMCWYRSKHSNKANVILSDGFDALKTATCILNLFLTTVPCGMTSSGMYRLG